MTLTTERLGWWPSLDLRRLNYPMRSLRASSTRRYRYWWDRGAWLDQGDTASCVGHAWMHWIEDGPLTHAPRRPNAPPLIDPYGLYREAQKVDPWPGEEPEYYGTSTDAGAKVLQNRGLIESYWWAFSVDEVLPVLLEVGPVCVGSWWWSGMDAPTPDEHMIRPSGHKRGGHAYVVNGVNLDRGIVRLKNSWGRGFGNGGRAYMTIDDLDFLLRDGGEAVIAKELPSDG